MKKWAVWKTVLVVISSILLVGGITVLGVYLAGGFKAKVVNPDSISFVVDDETLFNSNTNQYEVTDTFFMTIQSTREDGEEITEKRVRLSLDGGRPSITPGKITDDILIIPEYVNIGESFEVRVNRGFLKDPNDPSKNITENGIPVSGIVGGISRITASSPTYSFSQQTVQVAVDTPVYKIETVPVDMNGKVLSQVTLNENFTFKTIFYPTESAYLFNDQKNTAIAEEDRRERKVFFAKSSTNVAEKFDDELLRYYIAELVSKNNTVSAYAFVNAKTQTSQIKSAIASAGGDVDNMVINEDAYNSIVAYLRSETAKNDRKSADCSFDIEEADITSFELSPSTNSMTMPAQSEFTLTMKETLYANEYLGARVNSVDGEELSMLKYVGIRFEYRYSSTEDWQDASEKLDIAGGGKVPFEDAQGRIFYFPNSQNPDTRYAFWRLKTFVNEDINFRLTVVLFKGNDRSGYSIYSIENDEVQYTILLSAKEHAEENVEWKDKDRTPITITLGYEGDQPTPVTYPIPLTQLTNVPAGNTYQDVRFFAYFKNKTVEEIKKMLGNNIDAADNYSGEYYFNNQRMMLYHIPRDLTVRDVGEFDLYFATIRVDANGREIIEDNKYVIEQAVEDPTRVIVTKTLYDESVGAMTTSVDGVTQDEDTNYYIHAGSSAEITLTFEIKSDSWEVFSEKVNANPSKIKLDIFDRAGRNVNDCVTVEEVKLHREGDNCTVSYILSIKGTLIDLENDIQLRSVTLTDLENSNLAPWTRNFEETYVLYTPRPTEITLNYTGGANFDFAGTINVRQTLSNDSEPTLSFLYKGSEIAKSITEFNALFSKTIVDQHDNSEIFANSWEYRTPNEDIILVIQSGKSFAFQTTKNVDSEGNPIPENAEMYLGYRSTSGSYSNLRSANSLKFSIVSTGIQKVYYDKTTSLTQNINGHVPNDSTSPLDVVEIKKYGSSLNNQDDGRSNQEITLKDLVTLYLSTDAEGKGATEYNRNNYKVILSQDVNSMPNETVVNLFGDDGMVKLTTTTGEWTAPARNGRSSAVYGGELKTALNGLEVVSLSFKHNFMGVDPQRIPFKIVDNANSGVVDITMNFNVLPCFTSSPNTDLGTTNEIYANINYFFKENEILMSYQNGDGEGNRYSTNIAHALHNTFKGGLAGIVADGETGNYKFKLGENGIGSVVYNGELGGLKFQDFWDVAERDYVITYYLEGTENPLAPRITLRVKVKRNIYVKAKDEQRAFDFTSTSSYKDVAEYIEVGRMEEVEQTETLNLVFSFKEDNDVISIVKKGNNYEFEINTENPIIFGYNQTKFTFKVSVAIMSGNNRSIHLEDIELDFTSGVDYEMIANRLENRGTVAEEGVTYAKAQVEEIDGINYLKVSDGDWYLGNTSATGEKSGYIFTALPGISGLDYDSSNLYTASSLASTDCQIRFRPQGGDGLYGLGVESVYTIVQISNGANSSIYMIVPTIVSRIGSVFGIYDLADEEGNPTSIAKIEDLVSDDFQKLIDEGKFKSVKAGQNIVIAKSYESDIDFNENEARLYFLNNASRRSIISVQILNNSFTTPNLASVRRFDTLSPAEQEKLGMVDGEVALHLNHLVGEAGKEYYVVLMATLTRNNNSQIFYYVVRVEPDTVVDPVVYPYADDAEYKISTVNGNGDFNPVTIDLDIAHDQTTLKNTQFRFNLKVDGKRDSAIAYTDRIYSVWNEDNVNNPNYDEEDFAELITYKFDKNATTGSSLTIWPQKDSGRITIVVRRSWEGVVGGTSDYTIVINDNSQNYILEYSDDIDVVSDQYGVTQYIWRVDRSEYEKRGKAISTQINLVDRTLQGGGAATSLVHNLLNVNAVFPSEWEIKPTKVYYNNRREPAVVNEQGEEVDLENGQLVESNNLLLDLNAYLDKDYAFDAYLYSQFGLLGTLRIEIKGSVLYSEATTTVEAGKTLGVDGMFTITSINGISGNITHEIPTGSELTKAPEDQALTGFAYEVNSACITTDTNFAKVEENNDGVWELETFASPVDKNINIKIILDIYFIYGESGYTKNNFTFNVDVEITKNLFNKDGSIITAVGENNFDGIASLGGREVTIISGGNKILRFADLFNGDIGLSRNIAEYAIFTWEATRGGNAFANGSSLGQDGLNSAVVTLEAQEVPETTECTVRIKLDLYMDINDKTTKYSTLYVLYSFVIEPNVKLSVNYPKPNTKVFTEEYMQDGDEIINIYDNLINAKAPFADEAPFEAGPFAELTRFVVEPQWIKRNESTTGGLEAEVSLPELKTTVEIDKVQNLLIEDLNEEGKIYTNDGVNNIIYSNIVGEEINPSLRFSIKYADQTAGDQAFVVLRMTCNNVVIDYKIVIVEKDQQLFNIQINSVNSNTNAGTGVETFYVDTLTKSTNIFENNRVLSARIKAPNEGNSNIEEDLSNTFQILLEKESDDGFVYKVVKGIKFNAVADASNHITSDIGQNVTIDLHESVDENFHFKGIYVDGKVLAKDNNEVLDEKQIYEEEFKPANSDYAVTIFSQTPTLTSRVELFYNGAKVLPSRMGGELKLAKAKNGLETNFLDYEIEQIETELDKVLTVSDFKFVYNNGSSLVTKSIPGKQYAYTIALDFEVAGKTDYTLSTTTSEDGTQTQTATLLNHNKYNTIYVNTISSLISTAGVYHKSQNDTKALFTREDLDDEAKRLRLEVMWLENAGPDTAIADAFKAEYEKINEPYYETNSNRYLSYAPNRIVDSETKFYDYEIRALGASNKGNFALLKVTYSVDLKIGGSEEGTTFTKDFYVVYKVVSDYQFFYSGTEVKPSADNDYHVSNKTSPYVLDKAAPDNNEVYQSVALAGGVNTSREKVVSVSHTYGDDAGVEVAAATFSFTMTVGAKEDGMTYNDETNVNRKLIGVVGNTSAGWSKTPATGQATSYTWKKPSQTAVNDAELTLSGIQLVNFGEQNYKFTAVDRYGYKFEVYLTLSRQNVTPPSLSYSGTLVEGESFDFGIANYELLSMTTEGEGENKQLVISRGTESTESNTTTILSVSLAPGSAWVFDNSFQKSADDKPTYSEYIRPATGDGNTATGYSPAFNLIDSENKLKYITDVPMFENIFVRSIKFLYDGRDTTIYPKGASTSPLKVRDSRYSVKSGALAVGGDTFQVPSLPGYVYDGREDVTLNVVVTLYYNVVDGQPEEIYEMPTTLTLKKSTTFVSLSNDVVRDDEEFDVKDYIQVSRKDGSTNKIVSNYDVYDDTLAIELPDEGNIIFTFEAVDSDGKHYPATSVDDEGNFVPKEITETSEFKYRQIQYYSISDRYANRTLDKNCTFSIMVKGDNFDKVQSGDVVFRYAGKKLSLLVADEANKIGYLYYDDSDISEDKKYASINVQKLVDGNDKINIAAPQSLNRTTNSMSVEKYYLISIPEKPNDPTSETNEYRYPVTYTVTSYYSSLATYASDQATVDEYIRVGNVNPVYIIPFSSWSSGLALNTAERTSTGLKQNVTDSFSKDSLGKLKFEIEESGAGAAVMDEYGNIITTNDFNIKSHHISVVIKEKVSGCDGLWDGTYFNLTGSKGYEFGLNMYDETPSKEIALASVKAYLKSENGLYTLTTSQRVLKDGEYTYEEREIPLRINPTRVQGSDTWAYTNLSESNLESAYAILSPTNLTEGQGVEGVDEGKNTVTVNGVNLQKLSGTFNIVDARYIIKNNTPILRANFIAQGAETVNKADLHANNFVELEGYYEYQAGKFINKTDWESTSSITCSVFTLEFTYDVTTNLTLGSQATIKAGDTRLKTIHLGSKEVELYVVTKSGITYYIPVKLDGKSNSMQIADIDFAKFVKAESNTLDENVIELRLASGETSSDSDSSYTIVTVGDYVFLQDGDGKLYSLLSNFAIVNKTSTLSPDEVA